MRPMDECSPAQPGSVNQMPPNPGLASTSPFDQLDPLQSHPNLGLSGKDPDSSSLSQTDLASVVKQVKKRES